MTEIGLHRLLAWSEMGVAVVTVGLLLFITAPYGRHLRRGFGVTLPPLLGWMVMEAPSALFFFGIYGVGQYRFNVAAVALLTLWAIHYLYRGLVFPWRLRRSARRIPWTVVMMGFTFNCLNAYLNARWISHLELYPSSWLGDPRFGTGLALFLLGFGVNQYADAVLLALRRNGQSGYTVPQGGLYRFVSCPNYLGEILEWTGWAIATWSLPGLAFAVFTAANLVPRAIAHHRWYRETFSHYPPERRALVPYLL